MPEPIAKWRGLTVHFHERALLQAVDLTLCGGRVTALVGASGSGKTLIARSFLGAVPFAPGIVGGDLQVEVDGALVRPLIAPTEAARHRDFQRLRQRVFGYIPQSAVAALDPTWTVERSLREGSTEAATSPEETLAGLGFRDPARVLHCFPHELSGGMAQRVVIAQALLRGCRFLLCDEPTTALDAPVQAGIVRTLRALVDRGVGLLMITHDLRLLPGFADEVAFVDAGRIVEQAPGAALSGGELSSEAARRLIGATRRIAGGRL